MTEQERQQHRARVEEIRTVVREFVRARSGFDTAARTPEEFALNFARAEPWVRATIEAAALELGEALAVGRESFGYDPGGSVDAGYRRENEVLRSNSDHLSSENASLARQVESMSMRIESLAEELAKPEDVRLRDVLDALDGRFPIFDSVASRVSAALDEAEEFIGRAGEAERIVEAARRSLSSVAESMTEHAYQELASALESPPRIAGKEGP